MLADILSKYPSSCSAQVLNYQSLMELLIIHFLQQDLVKATLLSTMWSLIWSPEDGRYEMVPVDDSKI